MKSGPLPWVRWLALAALADWLLTRTLTRSAIFMPKSPLIIGLYQALGFAGQMAAALTALLALGALGWIAWQAWRGGGRIGAGLLWASLPILSLVFLFAAPTGWLAAGYQGLLLTAVALLVRQLLGSEMRRETKIAGAFVGLALLTSALYQVIPAIYEAGQWPGPPPLTGALYNVGELWVVLSPVALWWAYGRRAARRVWLGAAIPVLGFMALRLANPALTGIIAIWSVGLTLYLPWPLYALSLWLAAVTAIATVRRGELAGWAVLLLVAGGYAPQLSTQAFLGLIALWLLAAPDPQPGPSRQATALADANRPARLVSRRAAQP